MDITEAKKNLLTRNIFLWFPGVIVLGVLNFVRHKSDFDSLIFKLSMEISTVIFCFFGLLQLKNVIVLPTKLKDRTMILNLIAYIVFALLWYGTYLLLHNILPSMSAAAKLSEIIHFFELAILAIGGLLLFLIAKELGKKSQKIYASQNIPKLDRLDIVAIIAGLIIVVCLALLFPSKSDEDRTQAMHFMRQHNYQAAITSMNQAIQQSNNNSPVIPNYYADRAYAYEKLGTYKEAIGDLTQSIDGMHKNNESATNPFELASLYLRRGNSYLILGECQSAIDDYAQVLLLDPKNASVYYNRGIAYEKLGKHDLAVKDREKFKELCPKP